ncbi:Sensitivity To Red Light Reduced-like SRR1 protein [Rutstroemia sp. NJR-2017a BBW]|nr:Sensitivity To Red Light Reduced-like SRR1 protein [Rutstroemia sp. NJR-2017a BBW]
MPHTNRKKKTNADTAEKKQPTKRIQVVDADGWVHVVGGSKKAGDGAAWTHAGDFERGGVAYINRTVEEMRGDYEYYRKQWESSEAAGELREILKGRERVGNVICLGLGSLQSARREGRRSSFTQLAALGMILEELAGGEEGKIQCIHQDPQFTDTDKEFLQTLEGTVVDDPAAFGHVTEDSLVYAIHCYAPVYTTISEGPKPKVVIGTDIDNFGRLNLTGSRTQKSNLHLTDPGRGTQAPKVWKIWSKTVR